MLTRIGPNPCNRYLPNFQRLEKHYRFHRNGTRHKIALRPASKVLTSGPLPPAELFGSPLPGGLALPRWTRFQYRCYEGVVRARPSLFRMVFLRNAAKAFRVDLW